MRLISTYAIRLSLQFDTLRSLHSKREELDIILILVLGCLAFWIIDLLSWVVPQMRIYPVLRLTGGNFSELKRKNLIYQDKKLIKLASQIILWGA